MSDYVYPTRTILADSLRAGAGMLIVFVPLIIRPPVPAIAVTLILLLVLFSWQLAATLLRRLTRVHLTLNGIEVEGLGRRVIAWHELARFHLRYYSTRRDRDTGWLVMTLSDNAVRIRLDSRLTGFSQVADAAVGAARRQNIPLDDTTLHNLLALGVTDSDSQREEG